jgi:uncharacterized protein
MSTVPQIRVPEPDDLDLAFFRATVEAGALAVQKCDACGTWTHPARYFCPACTSPDFAFRRTSGRATVHSYTVSHMSLDSAWKAAVPFVTIVAELDEGPRIVAAARGIALAEVRIGQKVRIVTEALGADYAFFWAEPD